MGKHIATEITEIRWDLVTATPAEREIDALPDYLAERCIDRGASW
jgi:hypothetical protein